MTEQEADELICCEHSWIDEVRLFWYFISKILGRQPFFWIGMFFLPLAMLSALRK